LPDKIEEFYDYRSNKREETKISPSLYYIVSGYRKIMYNMIKDIKDVKQFNVLDIGCGKAFDLIELSPLFKECYGMDISQNELNLASKTVKEKGINNIKFKKGVAEKIPFEDNTFDLIIFSEVIEHLPNVNPAMQEIKRVFKKEGYIMITTPNRYRVNELFKNIVPRKLYYKLKKRFSTDSKDVIIKEEELNIKEHFHEYSVSELKKLLKANNFEIINFKGGKLTIFPLFLFDKFPFLINIVRLIDNVITFIPGSIYLKFNFIVLAKKL